MHLKNFMNILWIPRNSSEAWFINGVLCLEHSLHSYEVHQQINSIFEWRWFGSFLVHCQSSLPLIKFLYQTECLIRHPFTIAGAAQISKFDQASLHRFRYSSQAAWMRKCPTCFNPHPCHAIKPTHRWSDLIVSPSVWQTSG